MDVDMHDVDDGIEQQPEASTSKNTMEMTSPIVEQKEKDVFLPPPVEPPTPSPLTSTNDLLGMLQLHDAYDKYVRPHVVPVDQWAPPPSATIKGKEKAVDSPVPMPATPGGGGGGTGTDNGMTDEEEREKKRRKKEGSYKHLIKSIPGKHSMKKDDYLTTTILVPPKQKIPIVPFDERTSREAFTVSLEGLKGFNAHALILESDQAREDRKRRKEAKKVARLQSQSQPQVPTLSQPQPPPPPQGMTIGATGVYTAPTPALTPGGPPPGPPIQQPQPHPVQQQQQQRGIKRERPPTPSPVNGSGTPMNRIQMQQTAAKKRKIEGLPAPGRQQPHAGFVS